MRLSTCVRLFAGASIISITCGAANAQNASPPTSASVAATSIAAAPAKPDEVADIIVTGSRLTNPNFTAPTPVQVIGSQQILDRAPTNIADVVNESPAFRVSRDSRGSGRIADQQSGVQSLLDLRGLGDIRTLILINGHRTVGTVASGSFDTSMIPVGLVDRVDVVTGGASAAYGSDAVAGVTNFVLKNHMQGVTGSVQSGITQYGDGTEYVGTFAAGTAFAGGRGHVIVGADASKSSGVGNIYTRPYGRVEPGLVTRYIAGQPASVFTNGVEYANYVPGGLITNTIGGQLYAFDASGSPYVYNRGTLAGAGNGANQVGSTSNYGHSPYSAFQLQNPFDRQVAYARADYDVTDTVNLYVEGNYGRTHLPPTLTADYTTAFLIPVSSLPAALRAQIPATTTNVTLTRDSIDFGGNRTWQTNQTYSVTAGAKGKLFGDFTWDGYYEHGHTHQAFATTGLVNSALYQAAYGCNGTATNPNLNATLLAQLATYQSLTGKTCAAFNPLGVGQGSAAAYNYFLANQYQTTNIQKDVVALNIAGTPFTLPAGPVSLAVGGEWRRDQLSVTADALTHANIFTLGNFTTYGGKNTVKEGFAEIGIPVLKDFVIAKSLDLNGAVRRTDYKLSGAVTTWKGGATWKPIDGILLRGTRSRDIRAPNLNELYFVGGTTQGANIQNTGIPGSANQGGIAAITSTAGYGNQNLRPEIADTTTLGAVVQPVRNLNLSLDFYKIRVKGAIVRLNSQQTVNACAAGDPTACNAITLDPTTANGIGFVRNITSNVNTLRVEGLDFELDYRVPTMPFGLPGVFSIRALVNHAWHDSLTSGITGITTEMAGASTGVPKWTGNVTFGYQIQQTTVQLQVRGFSHVKYDPTLLDPTDAGYVATAATTISQNRFPGRAYGNVTFEQGAGNHLTMFAIVNNVLNSKPPAYVVIAATAGSRELNYDLLGRAFKVGARFKY
jgi:outer membrane receptor protein involved in Fe transport